MAELNCENDKTSAECEFLRAKNSKGKFVSSGKLKKNLDKVAVMKKGKILNERKRKLAVCNNENGRASDDDASKKDNVKKAEKATAGNSKSFLPSKFFSVFSRFIFTSLK